MTPQQALLRKPNDRDARAFHARAGAMTKAGRHEQALAELPDGIGELASTIQGLCVHQYLANAYGFKVPEERKAESHIRAADQIIDCILALDERPLSVARPVDRRVVGVCHHFALLMTTMLRAKGIPARCRCGFGAYFNAPWFEEHLVCEYWSKADSRWVLADSQLDAVWRHGLKFGFDPLDVPRDQFLAAGDAWMRCRSGRADPSKFGIFVGDLRGLWFIAAEVIRDVAALAKVEMLPWDVWGAMPRPDQQLGDDQLTFFDRLAALTIDPDRSFPRL
ncbi:MAG TPA: transglutaminase-like domain-containing protein, partial [Dongiaceae bacterium]